jgi:hypothetical protein
LSPISTVHFQPGQWTLRLNVDGTYLMKGPLKSQSADSQPATGTYEVHGHDLTMTSPKGHDHDDLKYRFTLKHHGKVLMLTDEGGSISANRE